MCSGVCSVVLCCALVGSECALMCSGCALVCSECALMCSGVWSICALMRSGSALLTCPAGRALVFMEGLLVVRHGEEECLRRGCKDKRTSLANCCALIGLVDFNYFK